MAYEYITTNNLYEKQNYMYSQYNGKNFLVQYINSREIKKNSQNNISGSDGNSGLKSIVYLKLLNIYDSLKNVSGGQENGICQLKDYIKSFEVRKRLYTEYKDWKPVEGASFSDYECYLLFADCLFQAYSITGCLKYYSCALKLDDTLLSIQDRLNNAQREHLAEIIGKELDFFQMLLKKQGIYLEAQL